MALIAMAVHCTDTNERLQYTKRTIRSLEETVNWLHHRIIIIDNGSNQETKDFLYGWYEYYPYAKVITNEVNVGTAAAICQAWRERRPSEKVIKMDDDVEFGEKNWLEQMEDAMNRMNDTDTPAGIVALKRKDLDERPDRTDWAHSELIMTPSNKGERWVSLERVNHCMGTVQMYNPRLIDVIGGLYQEGVYGLDDSDAAIRCNLAGFHNYFLYHIPIEHIDSGGTDYAKWKQDYAGEKMAAYQQRINEYVEGTRSIYHPL